MGGVLNTLLEAAPVDLDVDAEAMEEEEEEVEGELITAVFASACVGITGSDRSEDIGSPLGAGGEPVGRLLLAAPPNLDMCIWAIL